MTTFEPPRPQDKVVMLKRVPVFSACTEEQLLLIADRTRLVEYKKGECIYTQGDAAEAFYIVSSGRLRIFTREGDHERQIAVLHNGDAFGEVSLLTGEVHSATAQTLNDALVLQLEKKDFDDVINRIPSLVLYLSRLLSKRLRTKEHGIESAEATIVAVYSAAGGVGRTCLTITLAASLQRETGQKIVVVDLSSSVEERARLYGGQRGVAPVVSREFLESPDDAVDRATFAHPLGISMVSAAELFGGAGGEQAIAPLLNLLTKRFHYILVDLPTGVTPPIIKALIQSDMIYLMTDPGREHIIRTRALIHQLQASMGAVEQRMKIILNRVEPTGRNGDSRTTVAEQLGKPVAYTLPTVAFFSEEPSVEEFHRLLESRTSPYTLTVRHIARELGGLLVGLALGSGAALGLAHIGILKVLEREKIPIDVIAGSSIGAMVGGLWASGHSADDLERMALRYKNPWDVRGLFVFDLALPGFSVIIGLLFGILVGWPAGFWTGLLFGFMVCVAVAVVLGPLAGGPIQGTRLMERLQEDFGGKTFADTWLPLKVIASNPMAREEIVFESGPLVDAVRASVSIPGIFKPVLYKGKICLDGGVVNPVPVSVLKRAGVNHVIAVNVFPTTPEFTAHLQAAQQRRADRDAQLATRPLPVRLLYRIRQELIRSVSPLVFDVIMRSMQFMEHQIAEISCREADITLRPTVPGSHWLEFFSPEKFIARGEEVALEHLPEIRRIAGVRSVDKL